MHANTQKELALDFIRCMNGKNQERLSEILADDFEFEMIANYPNNAPIRGREQFLGATAAFAEQMFPNGISFKFVSVLADGPEVAVQAESETTAFNGRHYANRYHYYFRFEAGKIAHVRDYCDTNYVVATLLS